MSIDFPLLLYKRWASEENGIILSGDLSGSLWESDSESEPEEKSSPLESKVDFVRARLNIGEADTELVP